MVTRNNLVYSIAAAQRIIGIAQRIFEVREWAWVILVRGPGFCQFMSKKLFKKHFADRRRVEAQNIDIAIDAQDASHYTALGSSIYHLHAHDQGVSCTCEDFKNQVHILKREGICKHGYAVLSHLGFDSLSDYVERDRGYERVNLDNVPVMLSNGARSSSQPRVKGRSVD